MKINTRVVSRSYDLDVDDPIEIVADYPREDRFLSKSHEQVIGTNGGVTLSGHGSGSVWVTWEDLPKVVHGLMRAMEDAKPHLRAYAKEKAKAARERHLAADSGKER